jgi:glycosyltransferase involved in cell wall biosynthesis
MRVVVDARTATDHFPGIGRYVANLCRALAALPTDAALDIVLLADPSAPATRQTLPDLPVVPCPVSPFSLSQQWRVRSCLARLRADVYHSPYYLMPYLPGLSSVVTCYDVIPLQYPADFTPAQRLVFRLAHLLALRSALVALAISESTRSDLIRWFGANPGRITVTPLAADPAFRPVPEEEVARVRSKFDLPGDYVLYFGSNKPHKNLVLLVSAWEQVLKVGNGRAGQGAGPAPGGRVLAIAGQWDARFPESRHAAETAGLGASTRFLGPVPEADLPGLYCGAVCFVFPSSYEGFGLPVLEAMACGVPVICSNTSSLPEVAGDAAILVDPADTAALAMALRRVLSDPALRAGMRERGIARSAQFSWERTARETLAVYESAYREAHKVRPSR